MATRFLFALTLLSDHGEYGGPQDVVLFRAREVLIKNYEQVAILAGHTRSIPGLESLATTRFQVCTAKVSRLSRRFRFSSLFSLDFARLAWRQVGTSDLVYVALCRDLIPLWVCFCAILRRRRLLLQTHGMLTTGNDSWAHRVVDFVIRPIIKASLGVVALTENERSRLVNRYRLHSRHVTVIRNPILWPSPSRTASSEFDAIYVGRLAPRKRIDLLVFAAEQLMRESTARRIAILGPDEGELDRVLRSPALNKTLFYLGSAAPAEVPQQLVRGKSMILPSHDEPWGNVLAYAIAIGMPVIVTESAALATEVSVNHLGVTIPDGDPEAIVAAILDIASGSWQSSEDEALASQWVSENMTNMASNDKFLRLIGRCLSHA